MSLVSFMAHLGLSFVFISSREDALSAPEFLAGCALSGMHRAFTQGAAACCMPPASVLPLPGAGPPKTEQRGVRHGMSLGIVAAAPSLHFSSVFGLCPMPCGCRSRRRGRGSLLLPSSSVYGWFWHTGLILASPQT